MELSWRHWIVDMLPCVSLPSLARRPSQRCSTEAQHPEAGRATRQKKPTVNVFTEPRTSLTPIPCHHCRLHMEFHSLKLERLGGSFVTAAGVVGPRGAYSSSLEKVSYAFQLAKEIPIRAKR